MTFFTFMLILMGVIVLALWSIADDFSNDY
jgi:hypothetical protein